MRITIKEPATGEETTLDAEPEDYKGDQGLRIIYPDKDSFVMVQKDGEWKVMDEEDINPDIIDAIAHALKTHDRYTSMTGGL